MALINDGGLSRIGLSLGLGAEPYRDEEDEDLLARLRQATAGQTQEPRSPRLLYNDPVITIQDTIKQNGGIQTFDYRLSVLTNEWTKRMGLKLSASLLTDLARSPLPLGDLMSTLRTIGNSWGMVRGQSQPEFEEIVERYLLRGVPMLSDASYTRAIKDEVEKSRERKARWDPVTTDKIAGTPEDSISLRTINHPFQMPDSWKEYQALRDSLGVDTTTPVAYDYTETPSGKFLSALEHGLDKWSLQNVSRSMASWSLAVDRFAKEPQGTPGEWDSPYVDQSALQDSAAERQKMRLKRLGVKVEALDAADKATLEKRLTSLEGVTFNTELRGQIWEAAQETAAMKQLILDDGVAKAAMLEQIRSDDFKNIVVYGGKTVADRWDLTNVDQAADAFMYITNAVPVWEKLEAGYQQWLAEQQADDGNWLRRGWDGMWRIKDIGEYTEEDFNVWLDNQIAARDKQWVTEGPNNFQGADPNIRIYAPGSETVFGTGELQPIDVTELNEGYLSSNPTYRYINNDTGETREVTRQEAAELLGLPTDFASDEAQRSILATNEGFKSFMISAGLMTVPFTGAVKSIAKVVQGIWKGVKGIQAMRKVETGGEVLANLFRGGEALGEAMAAGEVANWVRAGEKARKALAATSNVADDVFAGSTGLARTAGGAEIIDRGLFPVIKSAAKTPKMLKTYEMATATYPAMAISWNVGIVNPLGAAMHAFEMYDKFTGEVGVLFSELFRQSQQKEDALKAYMVRHYGDEYENKPAAWCRGKMSDEDKADFEAQWEREHGGEEKGWGVAWEVAKDVYDSGSNIGAYWLEQMGFDPSQNALAAFGLDFSFHLGFDILAWGGVASAARHLKLPDLAKTVATKTGLLDDIGTLVAETTSASRIEFLTGITDRKVLMKLSGAKSRSEVADIFAHNYVEVGGMSVGALNLTRQMWTKISTSGFWDDMPNIARRVIEVFPEGKLYLHDNVINENVHALGNALLMRKDKIFQYADEAIEASTLSRRRGVMQRMLDEVIKEDPAKWDALVTRWKTHLAKQGKEPVNRRISFAADPEAKKIEDVRELFTVRSGKFIERMEYAVKERKTLLANLKARQQLTGFVKKADTDLRYGELRRLGLDEDEVQGLIAGTLAPEQAIDNLMARGGPRFTFELRGEVEHLDNIVALPSDVEIALGDLGMPPSTQTFAGGHGLITFNTEGRGYGSRSIAGALEYNQEGGRLVVTAAKVDPSFQSKGVFTRMSNELLEQAEAKGLGVEFRLGDEWDEVINKSFGISKETPYVYERVLEPATTTWYHGTGGRVESLEGFDLFAHAKGVDNAYGPGLYLTDNPSVAKRYAGQIKNRTDAEGAKVFQAGVDVPPERVLDLEVAAPENVAQRIRRVIEESSLEMPEESAALKALAEGRPLKDIYPALKEDLAGLGNVKNEVDELFGDINKAVLDEGYDALSHVGGAASGAPEHNVLVLLDPMGAYGPRAAPAAAPAAAAPGGMTAAMPTGREVTIGTIAKTEGTETIEARTTVYHGEFTIAKKGERFVVADAMGNPIGKTYATRDNALKRVEQYMTETSEPFWREGTFLSQDLKPAPGPAPALSRPPVVEISPTAGGPYSYGIKGGKPRVQEPIDVEIGGNLERHYEIVTQPTGEITVRYRTSGPEWTPKETWEDIGGVVGSRDEAIELIKQDVGAPDAIVSGPKWEKVGHKKPELVGTDDAGGQLYTYDGQAWRIDKTVDAETGEDLYWIRRGHGKEGESVGYTPSTSLEEALWDIETETAVDRIGGGALAVPAGEAPPTTPLKAPTAAAPAPAAISSEQVAELATNLERRNAKWALDDALSTRNTDDVAKARLETFLDAEKRMEWEMDELEKYINATMPSEAEIMADARAAAKEMNAQHAKSQELWKDLHDRGGISIKNSDYIGRYDNEKVATAALHGLRREVGWDINPASGNVIPVHTNRLAGVKPARRLDEIVDELTSAENLASGEYTAQLAKELGIVDEDTFLLWIENYGRKVTAKELRDEYAAAAFQVADAEFGLAEKIDRLRGVVKAYEATGKERRLTREMLNRLDDQAYNEVDAAMGRPLPGTEIEKADLLAKPVFSSDDIDKLEDEITGLKTKISEAYERRGGVDDNIAAPLYSYQLANHFSPYGIPLQVVQSHYAGGTIKFLDAAQRFGPGKFNMDLMNNLAKRYMLAAPGTLIKVAGDEPIRMIVAGYKPFDVLLGIGGRGKLHRTFESLDPSHTLARAISLTGNVVSEDAFITKMPFMQDMLDPGQYMAFLPTDANWARVAHQQFTNITRTPELKAWINEPTVDGMLNYLRTPRGRRFLAESVGAVDDKIAKQWAEAVDEHLYKLTHFVVNKEGRPGVLDAGELAAWEKYLAKGKGEPPFKLPAGTEVRIWGEGESRVGKIYAENHTITEILRGRKTNIRQALEHMPVHQRPTVSGPSMRGFVRDPKTGVLLRGRETPVDKVYKVADAAFSNNRKSIFMQEFQKRFEMLEEMGLQKVASGEAAVMPDYKVIWREAENFARRKVQYMTYNQNRTGLEWALRTVVPFAPATRDFTLYWLKESLTHPPIGASIIRLQDIPDEIPVNVGGWEFTISPRTFLFWLGGSKQNLGGAEPTTGWQILESNTPQFGPIIMEAGGLFLDAVGDGVTEHIPDFLMSLAQIDRMIDSQGNPITLNSRFERAAWGTASLLDAIIGSVKNGGQLDYSTDVFTKFVEWFPFFKRNPNMRTAMTNDAMRVLAVMGEFDWSDPDAEQKARSTAENIVASPELVQGLIGLLFPGTIRVRDAQVQELGQAMTEYMATYDHNVVGSGNEIQLSTDKRGELRETYDDLSHFFDYVDALQDWDIERVEDIARKHPYVATFFVGATTGGSEGSVDKYWVQQMRKAGVNPDSLEGWIWASQHHLSQPKSVQNYAGLLKIKVDKADRYYKIKDEIAEWEKQQVADGLNPTDDEYKVLKEAFYEQLTEKYVDPNDPDDSLSSAMSPFYSRPSLSPEAKMRRELQEQMDAEALLRLSNENTRDLEEYFGDNYTDRSGEPLYKLTKAWGQRVLWEEDLKEQPEVIAPNAASLAKKDGVKDLTGFLSDNPFSMTTSQEWEAYGLDFYDPNLYGTYADKENSLIFKWAKLRAMVYQAKSITGVTITSDAFAGVLAGYNEQVRNFCMDPAFQSIYEYYTSQKWERLQSWAERTQSPELNSPAWQKLFTWLATRDRMMEEGMFGTLVNFPMGLDSNGVYSGATKSGDTLKEIMWQEIQTQIYGGTSISGVQLKGFVNEDPLFAETYARFMEVDDNFFGFTRRW